ncbi:winged helix-turn-helix transcriptional regulator [Seongchinamella sediminis]|uniref:Winged helix-turn-helix transcriptional regulator n=1 Tax=Seongchinamella sediminis TaxID=2283635 RepID=A0A3L7E401_9GAMM|nr:Lrp/AsnC family transcriptional regulator [Seongchinamella sediminis]RLQ23171.1 winged helix-turn-helix transcriptional regulator [Seongchinamella sediminis]
MRLDRAEREILQVLQNNGRVSNVELADQVGLSESPCFRRVRALEEAGVITGYSARLNQRELGLQVTAFVQVTLDKRDDKKQRAFLAQVEAEEHIVECHALSGSHDYLLKVVARSMEHFSELAMQRILKFPGVSNIESNFSLLAVKEHGALPVPRVE